MKSKKEKKCKDCDACKKVYRICALSFIRDREYYCTENEMLTQNQNGCDRWRKKVPCIDLSTQRFEKLKEDLEFIFSVYPVICNPKRNLYSVSRYLLSK